MKGITPVIALILLLLITISLVGFAFIFFNRLMKSVTESTESEIENQLTMQAKKIKIDNIAKNPSNTTIYVRNIGTALINSSELTVYLNDDLYRCNETFLLGQSSVEPCTILATCSSSDKISVVAPGNSDSKLCE